MIAGLSSHTRQLKAEVAALENLRAVNQKQHAEIEAMAVKALITQQRLNQLDRLETELRVSNQQASLIAPETETVSLQVGTSGQSGRGGPETNYSGKESLFAFASLIPGEVTRPRLPLDLASGPRSTVTDPQQMLEKAHSTKARIDAQLDSLHAIEMDLILQAAARERYLDYLAHRPTGIPVENSTPTDTFGWRWNPLSWGRQFHYGFDLAANWDEEVTSTADGVVAFAGWKTGGFGYTVIIDHGHGFTTLYAHLSDWDVRPDQPVKRGEVIGWVGSSGASTGPHVHYEVHLNGVRVDPAKYLR